MISPNFHALLPAAKPIPIMMPTLLQPNSILFWLPVGWLQCDHAGKASQLCWPGSVEERISSPGNLLPRSVDEGRGFPAVYRSLLRARSMKGLVWEGAVSAVWRSSSFAAELAVLGCFVLKCFVLKCFVVKCLVLKCFVLGCLE